MSRLRYWRGRWQLLFGWCPACYSSPPQQGCRVCVGSYDYGPLMSDEQRALWRARWEALR